MLDENPNCAETFASFRLVGPTLDPEAVSEMLGLVPAFERTGVWGIRSQDAVVSTSLERHLIHLLEVVEPVAPQLSTLADIRADFFCYWRSATGHGGPEISPETLRRIAALDASLGIDFYETAG